ncbi:MAG: hydrolase 2, exosortase A system-associated, partial [Burkholderiaceae bacterium]
MHPEVAAAFEASACFFEAAPGGPRFLLIHRPTRTARRGTIVFAHPFAEELNKCRRMVAQTARALAADGWLVVQPDLYGCGDSAGEFAGASWDGWIDDLRRVIAAWHDGAGELWLWGLRAGALLLPPLLEPGDVPNLLLWQPSLDGSQVLNQFLRLRTTADSLEGDRSTDRRALRRQLASGAPIEVAGYLLPPRVANSLAEARFELPAGFNGRVVWLEVVGAAGGPAAAPAQRRVGWGGAGGRA